MNKSESYKEHTHTQCLDEVVIPVQPVDFRKGGRTVIHVVTQAFCHNNFLCIKSFILLLLLALLKEGENWEVARAKFFIKDIFKVGAFVPVVLNINGLSLQ